MIPYLNARIYGPYLRKDGRKHIIAIFENNVRKTVSYPKYLMELHIGRYLDINETIDHIDKDKTNDNINNLQILNKSEHSSKDARKLKPVHLICLVCSGKFSISGRKLHEAYQNRDLKNTTGPFCSKSCAGKSKSMGITINILPEKEYEY